jgi:hypothetical protein
VSEISDETVNLMKSLAAGIDEIMNGKVRPKKNGFVLLVFPFDGPEDQRCNYVSNAERADIVVLLKELVARFEGQTLQSGRA